MKKLLLALLILSFLTLSFVSCEMLPKSITDKLSPDANDDVTGSDNGQSNADGEVKGETEETPSVNQDPSHKHSYTTSVTEPTCLNKGYTLHTCDCGHSYKDRYTKALGHNEVSVSAKAPTCAEEGWDAHVSCSRCSYSTKTSISATGHTSSDYRFYTVKLIDGKEYAEALCKTCYKSYDIQIENALSLTVTKENRDLFKVDNISFYIPEAIIDNGVWYKVTEIGENAFINHNLQEIMLSNSVTAISKNAFKGCVSLKSVTFTDSITSIGEGAFYECFALQELTLPKNLTSISTKAFYSCVSLRNVTLPESLTLIGDSAFEKCSKLTKIEIPSAVTEIGAAAFKGCSALSYVSNCQRLTAVGDSAFSGCKNMSMVYYKGTAESASEILVGSDNDYFAKVEWRYYSQNTPTSNGWYYNESGLPYPWLV